jgi:hypothetical protein
VEFGVKNSPSTLNYASHFPEAKFRRFSLGWEQKVH